METSLKNKPMVYFSNHPAIAVACMFIFAVLLVIIGGSRKEMTIVDGGTRIKTVTYRGIVKDVLEQNKIDLNEKDKISPGLESVVKNGSKIIIKRAVPVKVIIDGREMQFLTTGETVEDLLVSERIAYNEDDKVYPEIDTALSKDMEIKIVRVTREEVTENQSIAFTNEVKEMPEWERGIEKVLSDGTDGEKQITERVTFEDGVEVKREVVDEKVIKPPTNFLVAIGTLDWRAVSRGDTIKFNKMLVMKATSYTDDIECTGKDGGNTATGTKPRRAFGGGKWSTVAVDPRVIPLGTKLWIEGYGFAIAEDTGGAVKGNVIDLFFENNTDEYIRWKTHTVRVYILR